MAKKPSIEEEIKRLLYLPVTDDENVRLSEKGIKIRHLTRLTLLAEKGIGGDISAFKELIKCVDKGEEVLNGVIVIDDIENKNKRSGR